VDIPRDVLEAGIREFVFREYPALADHGKRTSKLVDAMIRDLTDGDSSVLAAIVAAIEAWETRPHPWAPLPAGTGVDWPEGINGE